MRGVPETAAAAFFERVRPAIEQALDGILPSADRPPESVHRAMRYSVFAGGKRLRPTLSIAAYSTFRADWQAVLPVAAALELIHTYSLIHDDLPAMDDDDLRRGQPSCHRQFGEATAILAGDALLTLAFQSLASEIGFAPDRMRDVAFRIAVAAGSSGGMIAGQVMDLEAEGGPVDPGALEAIHRAKTGALVEVSLMSGALLGAARGDELAAIEAFGRSIGLAFQITDDILDEVAAVETLGKTPGKDLRRGKATYPGLYGLDTSRRAVGRLTEDARRSLEVLGERGALLAGLADYLGGRTR